MQLRKRKNVYNHWSHLPRNKEKKYENTTLLEGNLDIIQSFCVGVVSVSVSVKEVCFSVSLVPSIS